jgi:hypothetical protein
MDLRVLLDRIVEAGAKAAAEDERQREIERLRQNAARNCGHCARWMTRQCPRERNVNGRNSGPSCASVPCEQFVAAQEAHSGIRSCRNPHPDHAGELRG